MCILMDTVLRCPDVYIVLVYPIKVYRVIFIETGKEPDLNLKGYTATSCSRPYIKNYVIGNARNLNENTELVLFEN